MAGQKYNPHGYTATFNSATIGGIISITPPEEMRGTWEATDGDSGGTREHEAGLRDSGEVVITVHDVHDDAGVAAVKAAYDAAMGSGSEYAEMVLTLPSGADDSSPTQTITFDAIPTKVGRLEMPQGEDAPATRELRFRVRKSVTFASA